MKKLIIFFFFASCWCIMSSSCTKTVAHRNIALTCQQILNNKRVEDFYNYYYNRIYRFFDFDMLKRANATLKSFIGKTLGFNDLVEIKTQAMITLDYHEVFVNSYVHQQSIEGLVNATELVLRGRTFKYFIPYHHAEYAIKKMEEAEKTLSGELEEVRTAYAKVHHEWDTLDINAIDLIINETKGFRYLFKGYKKIRDRFQKIIINEGYENLRGNDMRLKLFTIRKLLTLKNYQGGTSSPEHIRNVDKAIDHFYQNNRVEPVDAAKREAELFLKKLKEQNSKVIEELKRQNDQVPIVLEVLLFYRSLKRFATTILPLEPEC